MSKAHKVIQKIIQESLDRILDFIEGEKTILQQKTKQTMSKNKQIRFNKKNYTEVTFVVIQEFQDIDDSLDDTINFDEVILDGDTLECIESNFIISRN